MQESGLRVIEFDSNGLFLLLGESDAFWYMAHSQWVAGKLFRGENVQGSVLQACHLEIDQVCQARKRSFGSVIMVVEQLKRRP